MKKVVIYHSMYPKLPVGLRSEVWDSIVPANVDEINDLLRQELNAVPPSRSREALANEAD